MRIFVRLSIIVTFLIAAFSASANLKDVANAYNKGNLGEAIRLSNHHAYKEIHRFLLSQKYLDKSGSSSFEEITNFLNSNQDWPQANSLTLMAESKITSSTSKAKIINWFDHNKPKTAKGYYHYYQAAIHKLPSGQKLNSIIKAAWINGSFSQKESEQFLAKHKKILTQDDHADKISELLWQDKIEEAKKFLDLVDKNYREAFNAWIIILKKNGRAAEEAFHKVKGSYKYTSGLLYSYLKLHMKNDPNSELISLHRKALKDEKHAKEWWKLKNYMARELFKIKKYKEAYDIVSNHSLQEACDKAEAEWFAGWLALQYLKNPNLAISHFENIYASSKSSISLARGSYWLGRSYKALNKLDLAKKWFNDSSVYGFTFYGQLGQYELGYKNLDLPTRAGVDHKDLQHYKLNPYNKISEFLALTERYDLLKLYVKEAFYSAKTPGEVVHLYDHISRNLNLHWNVEIAKLAQQAGVLIPEAAYPHPFKTAKNLPNKVLTYSIIRQESVFDQHAVSSAEARGLMQIIAPTAKSLCKDLGIKYEQKKLTSSIDYNIKLGSHYLKMLMKEHDSYVMTAANYNAGPVVKSWEDIFGSRESLKLYQAIDWIESIPYYETRNYVQRVIENIQVYKYMLSGNRKLTIKEDIIR